MAKYETSVASFASPLQEVNQTGAAKNTIGALCHKAEYPINKGMLQKMQQGTAAKIHQFQKYAKDHYTYGLPNGTILNKEIINTDEIKAAIESDLGEEVVISRAILDTPEPLEFARAHARRYWGYDYDTDLMSNPPYYASDRSEEYKVPSIINADIRKDGDMLMDVSNEVGYKEDLFGGGEYYPKTIELLVKQVPYTNPDYPYLKPLDPLLYNPDTSKLYYQVVYSIVYRDDAGNITGYSKKDFWQYEQGLGRHPELDLRPDEDEQPFLPIIPLRENNKHLGPELDGDKFKYDENGNKIKPDTELYRTSVKLLKRINLDYDELSLAVASNPDVGDIDHAYVTFAINIRTETKEGKKYLFQFFKDLALRSGGGSGEIEIKDAAYRVNIRFESANLTAKAGNLANQTELIYNGNTLTLRKKIDNTQYEEVVVEELYHVNYIYGKYNEATSLEASADEDNYNFLIPIQYNLIKEDRSLFGRQDLLGEAMVLVFNCYERRKLKWYESGFFQFLVIVITIVLTAITGVGGSFFNALTTAYQAGIGALALFIGQTIAISLAINYALVWAVQELGIEWAIFIAVIAAVITVGKSISTTGSYMSADTLLAATSSISTSTSAITKGLMEEIQIESEAFIEYAEDMQDELDELMEELTDYTNINYDIVYSRKHIEVMGETPDDFYNRTIHSGNVGALVFGMISTYVDNELRLPELNKIT